MKSVLVKVLTCVAITALTGPAKASEGFPYKYVSCGEPCGENGCGISRSYVQIVNEGFHDIEMTAYRQTYGTAGLENETVVYRAPMYCDLKDIDGDGFGTLLTCKSHAGDSSFKFNPASGGVLELVVPGLSTSNINSCGTKLR